MRRHTIVHTRSSEEEVPTKDIVHTSYHITVEDGIDSRSVGDEVEDAPLELKDGGQATVDALKELNLGNNEDSRTIFVSASLTMVEEEEE